MRLYERWFWDATWCELGMDTGRLGYWSKSAGRVLPSHEGSRGDVGCRVKNASSATSRPRPPRGVYGLRFR